MPTFEKHLLEPGYPFRRFVTGRSDIPGYRDFVVEEDAGERDAGGMKIWRVTHRGYAMGNTLHVTSGDAKWLREAFNRDLPKGYVRTRVVKSKLKEKSGGKRRHTYPRHPQAVKLTHHKPSKRRGTKRRGQSLNALARAVQEMLR